MANCPTCKNDFPKKKPWQVYCSANCRCNSPGYTWTRKPKVLATCLNCNGKFETNRNAKYCTQRCNNTYWKRERESREVKQPSNVFQKRWELLWRVANKDLKTLMMKVEDNIPLWDQDVV